MSTRNATRSIPHGDPRSPSDWGDYIEGTEVSVEQLPAELQAVALWNFAPPQERVLLLHQGLPGGANLDGPADRVPTGLVFAWSLKETWSEYVKETEQFKDFRNMSGRCRGTAWRLVPKDPTWDRNPWRKMHSREFWCWYRPLKETP